MSYPEESGGIWSAWRCSEYRKTTMWPNNLLEPFG